MQWEVEKFIKYQKENLKENVYLRDLEVESNAIIRILNDRA
jgi:hypothetical protein